MSTEDIIAALAGSDRADLAYIRLYVEWIRIRRKINHHFYFEAHWIPRSAERLPVHQAHWI